MRTRREKQAARQRNRTDTWLGMESLEVRNLLAADLEFFGPPDPNTDRYLNGAGDFDFGTVSVGENAELVFRVRNDGDQVLSITSVNLPAGVTFGTDTGDNLITSINPPPAPRSDNFTLVLDTSTPGVKAGTVTINSNDPGEPALTFDVTGTVVDVNGGYHIH